MLLIVEELPVNFLQGFANGCDLAGFIIAKTVYWEDIQIEMPLKMRLLNVLFQRIIDHLSCWDGHFYGLGRILNSWVSCAETQNMQIILVQDRKKTELKLHFFLKSDDYHPIWANNVIFDNFLLKFGGNVWFFSSFFKYFSQYRSLITLCQYFNSFIIIYHPF